MNLDKAKEIQQIVKELEFYENKLDIIDQALAKDGSYLNICYCVGEPRHSIYEDLSDFHGNSILLDEVKKYYIDKKKEIELKLAKY